MNGVLQFPGCALGQHPDDALDRVDDFDRTPVHEANETLWLTRDHSGNSLQVAGVSVEELEAAQGMSTANVDSGQHEGKRWNRYWKSQTGMPPDPVHYL